MAKYADMQPYGPPVLRLALGAVFMAHGAQKLFGVWGGGGPEGTAAFFGQVGLFISQYLLFYKSVIQGGYICVSFLPFGIPIKTTHGIGGIIEGK